MTAEEAYKYGFLTRCAEAGLGVDAAEGLVKRAFGLGDAAGVALKEAPIVLGAGALAGGVAGGYTLYRALSPRARIEDMTRKEVADLYASFADDLERSGRDDLAEEQGD